MSDGMTKHLNVPATFLDVRTIDALVVEFLRQAGWVEETVIENVEMALHEICCNIVEHSYQNQPDGRIDVTASLFTRPNSHLKIVLCDTGKSFDWSSMTLPDFDLPQEKGYGLFIASAYLDDMHYERLADRNVWYLTKKL